LYDEILQIPLIIKFPNNKYASKKIKDQVRLLDITKTISDYLNYTNTKKGLDGCSLIKVINNKRPCANLTAIGKYAQNKQNGYLFSIRTTNYKYIINTDNDSRELYDIKEDPNETTNLILKEDKLLPTKIFKKSEQILENSVNFNNTEAYNINKTLKRRLRELGYINN